MHIQPQTIKSLKDFYQLMQQTASLRKKILGHLLNEEKIPAQDLNSLTNALDSLEQIKKIAGRTHDFVLSLGPGQTVILNLFYEIEELKKDLFFLKFGKNDFLEYLSTLYPHFNSQVRQIVNRFHNTCFDHLITDRDGTINNYCGRYQSSIQSIYNGYFLTCFARKKVNLAMIITAAPLQSPGIVDVTITPPAAFILCASKGREFLNQQGKHITYPVEKNKAAILNKLNCQLQALIKDRRYEKFSLIGSGLQLKFGQTTIARQDISRSVTERESKAFLARVKEITAAVDQKGEHFKIEDTGLDIEINLTTLPHAAGSSKEFDKGDGLSFLNQKLQLNLGQKTNLICGDTISDLPLLQTASSLAQEPGLNQAVFVTQNQALIKRVKAFDEKVLIVSAPDILVAGLHQCSSFNPQI